MAQDEHASWVILLASTWYVSLFISTRTNPNPYYALWKHTLQICMGILTDLQLGQSFPGIFSWKILISIQEELVHILYLGNNLEDICPYCTFFSTRAVCRSLSKYSEKLNVGGSS